MSGVSNGGDPGSQEYLTPEEAARVLKVTRRTVYTWLRSGRLEGAQINGIYWRIPEKVVQDFLRE